MELEVWRPRQQARMEKEAVSHLYDPEADPTVVLEVFEVVWQA